MTDKLTLQLERLEKQYDDLKKDFASDGNVDRSELVILKSVQTKLQALKKKIVEHNAKKGIVDFSDEDTVITVGVKSYDDSTFKAAFNQSIRDWAQDSNIALNRVKTYFIKSDGPSGITVTDILNAVGLVMLANPAAGAAMGALKASAALVQAAYKATLPATPSLNAIHSSWAEALGKYGSTKHDVEYARFVTDWKKKKKVPDDVTEVPVNEFLPACTEFAGTYMPSAAQVEKAFLSKVVEKGNVEDSWDSNLGGGLDDAGVAEIDMVYLARNFSQPKGQLDDVSEQLLEAIRTVWSKNLVIDLPVQIYFSIQNVNSAELAEIQRTSRKPGDTSFKLRSGDKAIYDEFMKQAAYRLPKVANLKYDGV